MHVFGAEDVQWYLISFFFLTPFDEAGNPINQLGSNQPVHCTNDIVT